MFSFDQASGVMRPRAKHLAVRIASGMANLHNHTVLFKRGRLVFVTYGLFMALAFAVGSMMALSRFVADGGNGNKFVMFTTLVLFPLVILGARGFSILLEWRNLLKRPVETLLKPGFMLHGGVVGGALAIVIGASGMGLSALRLLDAWALAMPIGEAVARVGCYVYGCCWGKQTHSHHGIRYTNPAAKVLRVHPHLANKKLYPAQIIGLGLYMGLFFLLLWASQTGLSQGMTGALYLMIHPALRVVHERFREDDRGHLFGPFTHTHLYSGLSLLAGVLVAALVSNSGVASPVQMGSVMHPAGGLATVGLLLAVSAGGAVTYGVHIDEVGQWMGAFGSQRQLVTTTRNHICPEGPMVFELKRFQS